MFFQELLPGLTVFPRTGVISIHDDLVRVLQYETMIDIRWCFLDRWQVGRETISKLHSGFILEFSGLLLLSDVLYVLSDSCENMSLRPFDRVVGVEKTTCSVGLASQLFQDLLLVFLLQYHDVHMALFGGQWFRCMYLKVRCFWIFSKKIDCCCLRDTCS